MNDSRRRLREIVQESLKVIAVKNYDDFIIICESINAPSLLEHRAIITSIAHPEILITNKQKSFALKRLKITFDLVLETLDTYDKDDERRIALIKGLNFAPSVIVAQDPERGFKVLESYSRKNKVLDKIIKENLKKNRLIKKYEENCLGLIDKIDKYKGEKDDK